jgi:hypothetical protein
LRPYICDPGLDRDVLTQSPKLRLDLRQLVVWDCGKLLQTATLVGRETGSLLLRIKNTEPGIFDFVALPIAARPFLDLPQL